MYETILLPVDRSDAAFEVADRAFDIGRATDAAVHALHVVETVEVDATASDGVDSFCEVAERRGREVLAAVTERVEHGGVWLVRKVREATPYRAIADVVDEADVNLVAMGTRRLTGTTKSERAVPPSG